MSDYATAIGPDIHARSIKACALSPMTGEVERASYGYVPCSFPGAELPRLVDLEKAGLGEEYVGGELVIHLKVAVVAKDTDHGGRTTMVIPKAMRGRRIPAPRAPRSLRPRKPMPRTR